jgi:hypothetical protein
MLATAQMADGFAKYACHVISNKQTDVTMQLSVSINQGSHHSSTQQ